MKLNQELVLYMRFVEIEIYFSQTDLIQRQILLV